jgi:hypothetical protein
MGLNQRVVLPPVKQEVRQRSADDSGGIDLQRPYQRSFDERQHHSVVGRPDRGRSVLEEANERRRRAGRGFLMCVPARLTVGHVAPDAQAPSWYYNLSAARGAVRCRLGVAWAACTPGVRVLK